MRKKKQGCLRTFLPFLILPLFERGRSFARDEHVKSVKVSTRLPNIGFILRDPSSADKTTATVSIQQNPGAEGQVREGLRRSDGHSYGAAHWKRRAKA